MDSGCYIAVLHLPESRRVTVGRLGRFDFPAGWWLYVGSAQRGLGARLARHERREKPLRWHLDYLSCWGRLVGAVLVTGDRTRECAIAAELARTMPRTPAGFGASDCRCGGHLFRPEPGDWPELALR